jgi:hypothetical protein
MDAARVRRLRDPPTLENAMRMQVRSAGCLFSIIASIVLTILLNVLLRACSTGGGW